VRLARALHMESFKRINPPESEPPMSNRLSTIATRQAQTRARDLLFAAFLAVATMVSITSVRSACEAATTHVAAR
jgi:hypothetical protein